MQIVEFCSRKSDALLTEIFVCVQSCLQQVKTAFLLFQCSISSRLVNRRFFNHSVEKKLLHSAHVMLASRDHPIKRMKSSQVAVFSTLPFQKLFVSVAFAANVNHSFFFKATEGAFSYKNMEETLWSSWRRPYTGQVDENPLIFKQTLTQVSVLTMLSFVLHF